MDFIEAQVFEKVIEECRIKGKIVVNETNMKKYVAARKILSDFIKYMEDGEVRGSILDPADRHGYLEADISIISLVNKKLISDFISLLDASDVFTISFMREDSLLIEIIIHDIFEEDKA